MANKLDIVTLESKGHRASLDELLQVVLKNLPCFKKVLKICKKKPDTVSPSDLSFATKFVAVFLFTRVKGSWPMTYQYLTIEIVGSSTRISSKLWPTTVLIRCF